ncbi:hypothetical protein [Halorubrum tebenquichense]|uniref:hypothetical protein n=1 Tax=Halorubrum tebenquichense TaxID=119434 RepID=UPI000AC0927E|nr:hypothetical protein [Halorubrum tebenquichense]
MSTQTPARLEDSGNDGSSIDGDTTATEPNPLGDAIAEAAPYANNRFHNGR